MNSAQGPLDGLMYRMDQLELENKRLELENKRLELENQRLTALLQESQKSFVKLKDI